MFWRIKPSRPSRLALTPFITKYLPFNVTRCINCGNWLIFYFHYLRSNVPICWTTRMGRFLIYCYPYGTSYTVWLFQRKPLVICTLSISYFSKYNTIYNSTEKKNQNCLCSLLRRFLSFRIIQMTTTKYLTLY